MKKKLLSFVLALIFIVTVIPLNNLMVYANIDNTPTIYVESTYAATGSATDVHIKIKDNPGIAGAIITVTYDQRLTLTRAENGEAFEALDFTRAGTYSSPSNFTWDSENAVTNENGIILTLSFNVSALAEANDILPISISYRHGDIYDGELNSVTANLVSGSITVINYLPGDVNDDGIVNGKDVTLIRRYNAGGYDVSINEAAADVNDDGIINGKDVTLIRRYIAGGYDVELKPSSPKCNHNMEYFNAKEATCTEEGNIEYWRCSICGKYYPDAEGTREIELTDTVVPAKGHTPEIIHAVPATTMSEGYTEGVWCDVCKTWLSGHERIEPIEENESNITYRLWYVEQKTNNGTTVLVEDNYLKQQAVNNPNANTYVEGVGISELGNPSVDGYDFIGWFERPEINANRVYSISSEERGDKILYAVWSKHVYTITYLPDSAGSTLQKITEETFTVDKETALQVPSWPNLVWVGWSDEDGNIVKSIPKGTAHDVSLTANWMSKRSQTVPNLRYSSSVPAIVDDSENGVIAFVYEIGDIQNVPIQQVEEGVEGKGFNLVKGQTHSISKTFTQKIENSEAVNISNTIANSTTKSDSWTLTEDWNESTSFSSEHSNEVTEEQTAKATQSFSASNKYSIGAGVGGSVEHIDENGKSSKVTKYQGFEANYSASVGANIGLDVGLGEGLGLKTGISGERKLGLGYKNGRETVDETTEKHTDKTTANWNVNQGFETSSSMSASSEFSQKVGQSVKDTYKYGEVLDFGGSNSNTVSSSNTSSESREYGSSVTYSTEEGNSYTVNETLTADADAGYYRKVLAANFRVFAVVLYDVENSAFSTMTYSLKINDSEHLFTDYSTVSSFDDYENGVLPFSVPVFVRDYVYNVIGASEGLRIDSETGIIEGYGYKDPTTGICYKKSNYASQTEPEVCDTDVIIPKYVVVDIDATHKQIVEVKGISASAFSGTTITSIHLNEGVTEIPDGAFENCAQLHYITGPNITKIGSNAFKDCTSLCEMELSEQITELGEGAFDGDDGVTVYASTPEIAETAMNFNVGYLTIDLSKMEGSLDNSLLKTADNMTHFTLNGGGKTFNNLEIESSAETTEINNITITSSVSNPLMISSQNVYLGYVRVSANGIALNLTNDSTTVTLNGNNYIESSSENAMLSKSIQLIEKEGSSSIGKLRLKGNALYYGTVSGKQFASFDTADHMFKYLTQEEYDRYFNSLEVIFEPNGGTSVSSISVCYGEPYGVLPVPSKDYYTFDGWFTENEGGEKIEQDSVVLITGGITLYARWTINPLSDWVRANEKPDDALTVNTKWSYDYTSDYALGSSSNYTILGSSTSWSNYGAWSSWSKTAVSNSDSRQVETKTVTDTAAYTKYNYYHWWGVGDNGSIYNSYGNAYWKNYESFSLNYELTKGIVYDTYYQSYSYTVSGKHGSLWWLESTTNVPAVTHTEYRYRDRSLIYHYNLESTNNPTGQTGVSNVVEWVQFRMK
ncbi:MAG: InlB B-repeat-containing protein [Clostridia bacterium]|nr:InlB B-repeat-containing protein [Clostridia bacterium]